MNSANWSNPKMRYVTGYATFKVMAIIMRHYEKSNGPCRYLKRVLDYFVGVPFQLNILAKSFEIDFRNVGNYEIAITIEKATCSAHINRVRLCYMDYGAFVQYFCVFHNFKHTAHNNWCQELCGCVWVMQMKWYSGHSKCLPLATLWSTDHWTVNSF